MKRENDRAGDDYQEPSKEAEDGTWKPSKKAKLAAPDENPILTPPASKKLLKYVHKEMKNEGQCILSGPFGDVVILPKKQPFNFEFYGQTARLSNFSGGKVERCSDDEHRRVNPGCEHIEELVSEEKLEDLVRCVLSKQFAAKILKKLIMADDSPLRSRWLGLNIELVDGVWELAPS